MLTSSTPSSQEDGTFSQHLSLAFGLEMPPHQLLTMQPFAFLLLLVIEAVIASTSHPDNNTVPILHQEKSHVITSLDHMDELAERKIAELIRDSCTELDLQVVKGRATLVRKRKKSYVTITLGTLLYDLSLLTGIAAAFWRQNWATWGTVMSVVGNALDEASYDAEGFFLLNLPDTKCVSAWKQSKAKEKLQQKLDAWKMATDRGLKLQEQKLRVDLIKFRINAEKSLSCVLQMENPAESRAIRGYLDFFKFAAEKRLQLLSK